MGTAVVTFLPSQRQAEVELGTSLLDAAERAGVMIRSSCGGDGTCGHCAVIVRSGEVRESRGKRTPPGQILACRSLAMGDCTIEVPIGSQVADAQVLTDQDDRTVLAARDEVGLDQYPLSPLVERHRLAVSPPTLTENASDLLRVTSQLRRELGVDEVQFDLAAIRQLPPALREGDFTVTLSYWTDGGRAVVFDVQAGDDPEPVYGLAVDIGTTTVAVLLVDLASGLTVDRRGEYNRQGRYGDDVITRIVHAGEKETGLGDLQWAVIDTVNDLAAEGCLAVGIEPNRVVAATVAGNTTMMHLFTGVPPDHLRLEPYIPAVTRFPVMTAGEVGLRIHSQAPVLLMPSVASYVGGDVVAGALVTGVGSRDEVEVLIDIGTNGEIVLGNSDWLVACACSAGPCFEGSGITCGMRAEPGAIQRIRVSAGKVDWATVGGAPARGICGSGLIDAIARLAEAGVIDRAGHLSQVLSGRLRDGDEGPEFVLASGQNVVRDVVIRESDIKNVLRAKAAIYAGIRCLLTAVDLDLDAITRLYIAGGFGSFLVLEDAITIGVLPDIDHERYRFAGNASVKGARLALLSRDARQAADEIASRMTYIELSVGAGFMEEFTSAMFLPHTDLGQFPSVKLSGQSSNAEGC